MVCQKKFVFLKIIPALFLFGTVWTARALAADNDKNEKGVVAGGVVFNIASDRKVEMIGGIMQPEPLDLYLKRLFQGVTERLDRLEKKVDELHAKK